MLIRLILKYNGFGKFVMRITLYKTFLFNLVKSVLSLHSMESNLNEFEQEPHIRPTLLTVLCILTFIGSGMTIVTNIGNSYQYLSLFCTHNGKDVYFFCWKQAGMIQPGKMILLSGKMRKTLSFRAKNDVVGLKRMTVENIRKSAIGAIISGVCTLLGALLMWRLRRNGFYLYIAGVIIGLVVPFYLYGNNFLAVGISSFSGFFGLVFIALYALNIKSLR